MHSKNHKSIAFVALGAPDSTMSLRARELASHLVPLGWETTVVFPDRFKEQWSSSQVGDGNQVTYQAAFARQRPFQLLADLRRIVRERNVRWIHFLNPELKAMLVSSSLFGVRYVGDWEDWHCLNRERGWRKQRLRMVDRWMRRRCDKVVTCSQWLKQTFEKLGRSDVAYVPYAELSREIPQLPNPFNEPTAVYMGSLRKYWDHHVVLEAAKLLAHQGKKPRIEIVGTGEDLDSCKEYCRSNQLSNVTFPGFLEWDDMLNRLRWAEVLLFPIELNEQNLARCPFKVFQYAKAKRPIITCAVGEVVSVLQDKPVYTECNAEAFAKAIELSMKTARAPDVDYAIEKHTWADRANRLSEYLLS